MPDRVIPHAKVSHRGTYSSTFLDFQLQKALNTNVSTNLLELMKNFPGPKTTRISSLRRFWNRSSRHYSGNAIDFELSQELVSWLVSEEGTVWRTDNKVTFMIEDKPGSHKLIPFKNNPLYAKFVFENPHATGDHIHINI